MKLRVVTHVIGILAAGVLAVAANPAFAGPACSKDSEKDKWIPETKMMEKIKALGYRDIRNFHVSKGKCYEIYAFDKEGRKAEVYFHPITGEIAESKVQ